MELTLHPGSQGDPGRVFLPNGTDVRAGERRLVHRSACIHASISGDRQRGAWFTPLPAHCDAEHADPVEPFPLAAELAGTKRP